MLSIQLIIHDGIPDWWESPDIWFVPGTDPDGVRGIPVVGRTAYLWATVTNVGTEDATQVQVDFWIANPALQLRKSLANKVGTAFADIAAGASQDVLCLVPWSVALVNGGHECAVVVAKHPADPLFPPPADPDVLDALTYRQIAQRNLSVLQLAQYSEIVIGVHTGLRSEKDVRIKTILGGELSGAVLEQLGVPARRLVSQRHLRASLSSQSQCNRTAHMTDTLNLRLAPGTSVPVFLNVTEVEQLRPDEYGVVKVVEEQQGRVVGGVSFVVVAMPQKASVK